MIFFKNKKEIVFDLITKVIKENFLTLFKELFVNLKIEKSDIKEQLRSEFYDYVIYKKVS